MRLHFGLTALLLLAGVSMASPAQAQYAGPYGSSLRSEFSSAQQQRDALRGGLVELRVDAAAYYVANMDLVSPPADEVNQAGLELAPGIYAAYRSARARGAIDYSLIGRAWEDSSYDDASHRLAANGDYTVVPELLFVRGSASYDDAIVDPARGGNYGGYGIFDRTNIQEFGAASVNPYLQRRFSDFQFDVSYTYGRVWYLDDVETGSLFLDNQDSIDQTALVSFGSADQDRAFDFRVFYEWQGSEFERSPDYRYDRAGLELGARLARTLRLVADGGAESDLDVSTEDGGLDSEYWHVGLVWTPDARTVAEARYGQRFFGDSWSLRISRQVRFVNIEATYEEDPTVETRNLALGDFDPGELPPTAPGDNLSSASSSPFVARNAALAVVAEGARTRLSLRGYRNERDYLQALPPDETILGAQLRLVRDFAANVYGEFQFRYDDVEQGVVDPLSSVDVNSYQDQEYLLRVTYEAWTNLSPSLEAGFLQRTGQDFGLNYDGYWFALRARYTF